MLCILQTLFHLSFPEKSDFTEEKREAHTVLVNPHRVNIPGQFCLISNPLSFQLFEAVSCEKKKKSGSERSPGEGNGNPLQYSCLENPMDGGAW